MRTAFLVDKVYQSRSAASNGVALMPQTIVRRLTTEEKQQYAAPYPTVGSRKPVRQWPCEIPIDGQPADVFEAMTAYNRWLTETDLPKLLFYATPGRSSTLTW
jgi:haloalkane dehalogenase